MSEQPPVAVLDPTLQAAGDDINARRAMLAELQKQQEQQLVDAQFNQMVAPLQQEQQRVIDTQFNAQVASMQQPAEHVVQSDFEKWESELKASASTAAVGPVKTFAPAVTASEQTGQLEVAGPQQPTMEPVKAFAPSPTTAPTPSIPEQPQPAALEQPAPQDPEQPLPASPEQPVPARPEIPAPTNPEVPAPPKSAGELGAASETSTGDQAQGGESTPEPPAGSGDVFDENKLKIGVVDVSTGVESHARDAAAERLNHETTGKGIKGFIKKVVWGNIGRDAFFLKYKNEAKQKILEADDGSGNLYAAQGGTDADHARASRAVVDRMVSGYLSNGEEMRSMKEFGKSDDPNEESAGSKLEGQIKDLVGMFAEGKIDFATLGETKKKILEEYGGFVSQEDRKKGLLFADNIMEVAKNAKAAFDHGIGLERIKAAIGIGHGDARIGVRSEARLNAAERVVDRLHNTKLGSLLNETTIIGIVGTAAIVTNITAKKTLSAVTRAAGLGFAAGVIAGARENIQIKKDRATHSRSMAEGGGETLIRSGKRREDLEGTRYRTKSAQELIASLDGPIENADSLKAAISALAEVEARIVKSDESNIDLIHFSSKTSVEEERWALAIKKAQAKVAVQKALTEFDDAALDQAGVTTRDASELFSRQGAQVSEALQSIEGDVSARDKTFRNLKRKRVAKMAALGFISGEIVGTGIQEIKGLTSESMQSIFEAKTDAQDRRTLLAGLFRGDSDGVEAHTDTIGTHIGQNAVHVGQNAVKMPEGYTLLEEADGSRTLINATDNTKLIDNVTFDADGKFSEATQEQLTAHGFSTESHIDTIDDHNVQTVSYTSAESSPADYIESHKSDFTQVSRNEWYGNDTPLPDHNENDIWWGGVNNTGIDENGNYVFNMAHMTADGSWNQGASANAQQLIADGKMKMALSISKDNISHVIMIDVDQNGNAVIPKDSFEGRNLFTNEGGQARYIGGYAEAVQLGDVKDGVQSMNMLATVEGDNTVSTVQYDVPHTQPTSHEGMVTTLTKIDTMEVAATEDLPTEVPPVIPIYSRKGLESPDEQARQDSLTQSIPPVAADEPQAIPAQPAPGTSPAVPVDTTPKQPLIPEEQREPVGGPKLAQDADEEIVEAELVDDEPIATQPKEKLEEIDGEVIEETVEDTPEQPIPGQAIPDRQTSAPEGSASLPRTPGKEVELYPRLGPNEAGRIVSVEQLFDEPGAPDASAGSAIGTTRPQLTTAPAQLTSAESGQATSKVQQLSAWVQSEPGRLQSRREVTDSQGNTSWVEADGSPIERSVDRERSAIHSYMDRLSQKDPEYVAGVELIANEMGPMNSATRVAVNIPVWNSATNLSALLPQYAVQTDADGNSLAPGTYEVNVLITRETGTEPSGAMLSARRFMDEFENTNGYKPPINLYEVEIDAPDHTRGYARKLLNDVVASRSIARPEQSGALYMEAEDDSSVTRVDKKMVFNALNKFDRNPQLDAVSGTIDRASSRVADNDMLLLRRRADDFLGILASQKEFRNPKAPEWDGAFNRIATHDSNTAISAEAYALIDGDQASDADGGASMGEKISMVRGDGQSPNLEVIGKVATRSDAEAVDGTPNDPSLARINPENEAAFANFLQIELERVKKATPSTAAADQLARRMMFWLGFRKGDYALNNGSLEVANWDNVRTTFADYRRRHSSISLT